MSKKLKCPICNSDYEYCHGKINIPYFRHIKNIDCRPLFIESETEEHLKGKRDLFEWIKKQKGVKNARLEKWIPETNQIPDIMFEYNNNKYVIEYQCTPISTEYINRHNLYNSLGFIDIWICGTDKFLQNNMREKFLESHAVGFYDSSTKRFIPLFNKNEYSRMVNIRYKYNHSKNTFWGFDLDLFKFNGSIYNILYGDIDVAREKMVQRNKLNYLDEQNYLTSKKDKYLYMQNDKVYKQLEHNVLLFNNLSSSWKFHVRKYHMKNNFSVHVYVEPIELHRMSYQDRINFWDRKCKKLVIANLEILKRCSNDIEYLKYELLSIMAFNRKLLLEYENETIRFMEV